MPFFLLVPLIAKLTAASVAKTAFAIGAPFVVAGAMEYAKSKARRSATQKSPDEVYQTELVKHRARLDAERDLSCTNPEGQRGS